MQNVPAGKNDTMLQRIASEFQSKNKESEWSMQVDKTAYQGAGNRKKKMVEKQ